MKSKHFDSDLQAFNFKTHADNYALDGIIFGLIYELEERMKEHLKKSEYKNSVFLSMINPHFDGFRNVAFALFFKNTKDKQKYRYFCLQFQHECYDKDRQKHKTGFSRDIVRGELDSLEAIEPLSNKIYGATDMDDLKSRIKEFEEETKKTEGVENGK